MSAYEPPTENLPIFDTVVFGARDEPLTLATASRYFLRYPSAQGNETLKDINVQQITQTANYNYYQSGTGIISQTGTGTNQFKDTNIAGALTTREITQDINYNLNQSGTGIISQTGTGTNLLKGITVSGITTLNNNIFANAQMTTRDIIQSSNYSLSQSGAGIISQTGTGTNQFKESNFIGNVTQNANYIITQSGSGTNTFNICQINDGRGSQNAPSLNVTETTGTKSLSVVPNSNTSGRQNEQISTGDTALLAVGSAVNTSVLFLGTWSNTSSGCGVRITNNQVVLRGGSNSIVSNATSGHTVTGTTTINGTITQSTGTSNIISQSGTGTNILKDSTIPNLTVNTSLDVNGPTTTRAITQDANFNLNQSGTGIISQLGTGTNLLKDTTISGVLSATTGDFNSITTGAIVMDIDTNITQSGTGIISQTGTGTNTFKDSTIPNLTVNTSLDVNGTTTCQTITQDFNSSLYQSGAGIIFQNGTGTNQFKDSYFFGNITQLSGATITQSAGLGPNTFNYATINDVRGSQNAPALNVTETTGTKSLSVVPNSNTSGRQNEQISTGDTALLAVGSAVNTSVLFLGTWTNTASGCGIRITNNQVDVRGGTNTIVSNASSGHTVTGTTTINGTTTVAGTITQATGTTNIISQTGTGTNTFKDSTIPNLTVSSSLDVNGATTTREITQDANYNLNQSGTGIISQSGTGTNALKSTTVTGAVGQVLPITTNYQYGDPLSLSVMIAPAAGNLAIGENTMRGLTSAQFNTALGYYALASTQTGGQNTAVGSTAMANCGSTAGNNTAVGAGALRYTTGNANTAVGLNALLNNTAGFSNAAVGFGSLQNNSTYGNNSALGRQSGTYNNGNNNCYLGYNTGQLSTDATVYDYLTCIGSGSGGTDVASNRIVLGSATGNEEIYLAGNPTIKSSAVTSNASLFPNITTGSINIGSGISSGNVLVGDNITTGNIYIGSNSGASFITSGNTNVVNNVMNGQTITLATSASGTVNVGNGTTTGSNNIMPNGTTGNLDLHNGSASGAGRIRLNRNCVLPTITTFATPASGELGYNIRGTSAVTNIASSGVYYTATTFTLGVGVWNIMCNFYYNCNIAGTLNSIEFIIATNAAGTQLVPTGWMGYWYRNETKVMAVGEEYTNASSVIYNNGTSSKTVYLVYKGTYASGRYAVEASYQAVRIA